MIIVQSSKFKVQSSKHTTQHVALCTLNFALPYIVGGCTALLVFYLLNPPLWHRPFTGIADFFYLNTHRGRFNVSILFWGRMYDLNHPLPWYNTLVWVAITFPVLLLAMLPFGIVRMFAKAGVRRQEAGGKREEGRGKKFLPLTSPLHPLTSPLHPHASRLCFSWLIVLNALVLLVLRAIPGTPPHDGVRLFVAAFPFLAIIAGIGMSQLWQQVRQRDVGRLAVILVLIVCMGNLKCYAPQWLSFYNAVIGGVNGASRRGFEPTYYWDALDAEVIAFLNANTAENEKILFTPAKKSLTLDLVRAWDGLQPAFRPEAPGQFRWYVFQLRPSGLTQLDRILLRDFQPAFVKYVTPPAFSGLKQQQTPVLYVFEYDDYLAVLDTATPDSLP